MNIMHFSDYVSRSFTEETMTRQIGHRREMKFDKDNPVPFVQPFLILHFEDPKINGNSYEWYVDVDGKIDKYFLPPALEDGCADKMSHATDLLKGILTEFTGVGRPILSVSWYKGSAGPTHLLRNGCLFRRVHIDDPVGVVAGLRSKFRSGPSHERGLCHLPNISAFVPRKHLEKSPAHCRCCGYDLKIFDVEKSQEYPDGFKLQCSFCP